MIIRYQEDQTRPQLPRAPPLTNDGDGLLLLFCVCAFFPPLWPLFAVMCVVSWFYTKPDPSDGPITRTLMSMAKLCMALFVVSSVLALLWAICLA
jgi:hypothetical protein